MKVFCCVCLICFIFPACAGVYECVNENGQMVFQDQPCSPFESQDFLPIQTHRTDLKEIKSVQRHLKKELKKDEQANRREIRLRDRTLKQTEKAIQKKERQIKHCERVRQKIKQIEDRLHFGCKLKQANNLRRQLDEQIILEQRYCTNL